MPELSTNSASPWRQGLPWLTLLVGVLFTAFGISYQAATGGRTLIDQVLAGVAIAIGGGILGAAISVIVTSRADQNVLEQVRDVVKDSLGADFTSDEFALEAVRKEWYHYWVTEVAGKVVWRHQRYRFDRSTSVGSIVLRSSIKDHLGLEHVYQANVGVRGTRLIMIESRVGGTEPPVIHVYPHLMQAFQAIHCGIAFLQSWDGRHLTTKVILSRKALVPTSPEGAIAPPHFQELERIWQSEYRAHNVLLPATQVGTGSPMPT